ncbi:RNA-directed DNA polymerase, eukaryota [Tanacetum coccineum]
MIKISKKGRRGVTKRKKERKRPVVLQERKKVAGHKKERKKARKKEGLKKKERDLDRESSKKEKGRKESKLIKISKKGRRGVTKRKKERKRPVVLQERKKVADHKKERKKARKKEGTSQAEMKSYMHIYATKLVSLKLSLGVTPWSTWKYRCHQLLLLVIDEECVRERDFSNCAMGRVKSFDSITKLQSLLVDEGFVNVTLSYLGGLLWGISNGEGCEKDIRIPSLNSKGDELFLYEFMSLNIQRACTSSKKEWVKELSNNNKLNFIAIQETKMEKVSHMDVKFMWGNSNYDYVFSEAAGNSGGISCIWEESFFKKDYVTISDSFVAIYGRDPYKTSFFWCLYSPRSNHPLRRRYGNISDFVGKRWNGELF